MQWNPNLSRQDATPGWRTGQNSPAPFDPSEPDERSDSWVLVVRYDPADWNDPFESTWDTNLPKDSMRTSSSANARLTMGRPRWSAPANLESLELARAEGIENCSSEVLVGLIHALKVLMQGHSYQVLDHILRTAEFDSYSPEAIVAVLRVSSAAKSKLYEWRGAVVRAKNELAARGLEVDRILEGLS